MTGASIAILAGGRSSRFGHGNKCLHKIRGKSMISWIIEACRSLGYPIFIVFKDSRQAEEYKIFSKEIYEDVKIVFDEEFSDIHAPIIGLISALKYSKTKVTLVLPCDSPFPNRDVVSFLVRLCLLNDTDAVVPRWPNGYLEPLHAAYKTDAMYKACIDLITTEHNFKISCAIKRLTRVLYVSTNVLKNMDTKLTTFLNVNSKRDLELLKGVVGGYVARSR